MTKKAGPTKPLTYDGPFCDDQVVRITRTPLQRLVAKRHKASFENPNLIQQLNTALAHRRQVDKAFRQALKQAWDMSTDVSRHTDTVNGVMNMRAEEIERLNQELEKLIDQLNQERLEQVINLKIR